MQDCAKKWTDVNSDPVEDLRFKIEMLKTNGVRPTQPREYRIRSEALRALEKDNSSYGPIKTICGVPVIVDDTLPQSIQSVY